MLSSRRTIKYDVGGKVYRLSADVINRHPTSMLAKIAKCPEDERGDVIFIDGNGDRFQHVVDYLVQGHVVLPPQVPKDSLLSDLRYYGITNVDTAAIEESMGLLFTMVEAQKKRFEQEMWSRINLREVFESEHLFLALANECFKARYQLGLTRLVFTEKSFGAVLTDAQSKCYTPSGHFKACERLLSVYKKDFQNNMARFGLRCTNLDTVSLSIICFDVL